MSVSIFELSRLKSANWVVLNNGSKNIEFWDLPMARQIKPSQDDLIYQVDKRDRIDSIAFNRYNDSRLWDVIADINGLSIPPIDFVPGDAIRLPSYNRVIMEIRK